MASEENFLCRFRHANSQELLPLTANQFMEVWKHYDDDGNGYIEGIELDKFFQELVQSMNTTAEISENTLSTMKDTFMSAYDENGDSRIDIVEMAGILPVEEHFLLLFRRDHPLDSSEEFIKIWKRFDANCNGLIEPNELKNFLRNLLQEGNKADAICEDKLQEYSDIMMKLFCRHQDGKLQLGEMAKLLRVKDNYLRKQIFKNPHRITSRTLDTLFTHYDKNRDGTIEGDELSGFIKDLLDSMREDYTIEDLERIRSVILNHWDVNKDGKIGRSELRMLLMEQASLMKECSDESTAQKDF